MKLTDLEFRIFNAVCERLDLDSSWRKLIEITSNTRFQLNAIETERCARCLYSGGSPSSSLLRKFDSIGMTVETLVFYLDKLKFEDCLRYLKNPEPLEITKQPTSNISILEGKRLEIHCEAIGFPYPEYVWFRGKDRVSTDKQGTLIIQHARTTDSGMYTCRVQNFHETTDWTWLMSKSCKVQVDPNNSVKCPFGEIRELGNKASFNNIMRSKTFQLPQIILQPTNKSSECGGPVVFKVEAQHPTDFLKYQWFHNDRPLLNANKNELRIENVSKKSAGRYQVRVYSQVDENIQTMSKVAKLEVNPEPNQYTAGDKVALVIGNAFYRSYGQVLPAVEFDLYHTKETFEKMGFKVIALLDQTLDEMKRAVDFFCHLVTEDAYVIFYCMGHGFLFEHKHFLVPWDLRQGNDVKESLCIESCMMQIQNKCPKMLMVLVDLCRQTTEHSQVEEIYPSKPSKSLPNYVIIYATILGEQSFEEGSNVCNPRGLFNKYLLDVLDNPDVKVNEIYGQLQHKFQRCPYNKEKYPQHPQMDITLEEPERSLWDPVASCYHGSDEIARKREQDTSRNRDIWQFAHVIPGNVHIPLDNKGLVVLSFSKYLSNVLLMKPIITNFNHLNYSIQVELHKERVNQVIQPVLEVQTDPPEYKFCNLQRLKDKLAICLTISIVMPDKPPFKLETELIDLGRPLAASLPW